MRTAKDTSVIAKINQKPKKKVEGLWIPNEILNIPKSQVCLGAKVLLAHFYSFGPKGCYQSNELLAEMFQVCVDTITKWVAQLKSTHRVVVKCPKGYYRTIWAREHPDVVEAHRLWYRKRRVPNPEQTESYRLPEKVGTTNGSSKRKDAADLRKTRNSPQEESGSDFRKSPFPPPEKVGTTNTETYIETNRKTNATPTPLPAGGQAPALLEERKEQAAAKAEQLKREFGRPGRRRTQGLTQEEFEQRKQQQKKALLGDKKI